MALLKAALGFLATAYVNDTVAKPRATGSLARSFCDRTGKPLLLIRGERMADVVMGDPVKANVVTRRAYPLPYKDRAFGAVLVVNVLERLKRPDLAIREWRRVADKVFVVTPSWWSPHAWLDPGNRWLVHPEITKVMPLWTARRSMYLLPVSDRGYGARTWSPRTPTSPRPQRQTRNDETSTPFPTSSDDLSHLFASEGQSAFDALPSSTDDPWSDQSGSSPFSPSNQNRTDHPLPSLPKQGQSSPGHPSDGPSLDPYDPSSPALPEMEDMSGMTSSSHLPSHLGSPPSRSSNSPSHLTVVSTPGSGGS